MQLSGTLRKRVFVLFFITLFIITPVLVFAQRNQAPPRAEGEGPFERLILYGATVIDGTGAVPQGARRIVIEGNRIVSIGGAGTPGLPIADPPAPGAGEKIFDMRGMYIMPGLIDMHVHINEVPEYVFKLWMGNGVTSVRVVGGGANFKEKSANNEITCPRIFVYASAGGSTPEDARRIVRDAKASGADGLKFFGLTPDVYEALMDEARIQGLRTACHLSQSQVARTNILDLARMGLTTMEHWYGLPESFLADYTIQDWPVDVVYNNEQHRFGQAGRLWSQAAPPYSEKWNAVMDELIELDFTLVPTLTIYEASRDLMRARRAEWHEEYTIPTLWRKYQPSRRAHGSYWYYWTTRDEIEWKKNYQLWLTFVNEYKNRGGRVCTGSDSGFIFNLFGFGYIREFELLQEAGFHPLEVVRAATLKGAEALGATADLGTIEPGKLADLIVVEENPLENFKVLYGTGAIKLNENNEVVRAGGVKYTIKDGIVYDAKQLLADVRKIVADAKAREGFEITQPGVIKK
ncbi:amidohydrolase family protein [candidate division KSB1 bacterium]